MIDPAPFLAWRPFLDPLPLHQWWWLTLIPLSLFVSMTYKAVRLPDLAPFWKQAFLMAAQMVLGMAGLAVMVYLAVEVLLPMVE